MVFSSLLFVFAFLAPQLLLYFLVKKTKTRNIILLVFSLIFYAWGGPKYLILLILEAFVSWYTAKNVEKCTSKTVKKWWLVLECVVLFGLLFLFKYTGFFLENLQSIIHWPAEVPEIILPIGISFYTFQLISYVVDVYREEVKAQPQFWKILLYCSLFHQCIAGPIVRYKTVAEEIEDRSVTRNDVAEGVRRFSIGLAKKAILANGCATIADTILPAGLASLQGVPTASMWLGMLCYMLQIYLDFSAYSDMAIGMGRMVGFHYLENFNYPYTANSIQDFWRKWHISLSTFFRDYVYIPLGGSRAGFGKTIRNMFIVWALTGMWHGASWNYILWGLYFFLFLFIERLFLSKALSKIPKIIGHVYALIVVFFGWVLFKYTDMAQLGEVIKGLFGIGHEWANVETTSILLNNIFFLIFAIISVFPLGKMIRNAVRNLTANGKYPVLANVSYAIDAFTPLILMVLAILALVGNSYNPFLYFQF